MKMSEMNGFKMLVDNTSRDMLFLQLSVETSQSKGGHIKAFLASI